MSKIEVRKLTKTYGSTIALDNIDLCFEEEKIYGLLGRNGAGKTTLLSLLCNKIFPDEGEVIIDNKNILRDNSKIKEIYCTTEKMLYPENMKVKDVYAWTNEFYASFDKEKALELSDSFKLNRNSRVEELSTGYSTIIKNIVALAVNTSVLLLDEPMLGLDANHRDLFYKELMKSYAQKPKTIVLSTHLIEEIEGVIEQVVIIDEGKILINDEINNVTQKGYMISGPKDMVERFIQDKNIIGSDMLGGLKTAYVFDERKPQDKELGMLEMSRLPLQKLVMHLTNGGVDL